MMKAIVLLIIMSLSMAVKAQEADSVAVVQTEKADSSVFKGRIYNAENKVYISMNLYDNNILVPQQEIFGEVSGYLGHDTDSRKWLIVSAKLLDENNAELVIINDYGSEDLVATLTYNPDGTYTLKQGEGSVIKFAVNRKWAKLPKKVIFTLPTEKK